jgi:hypothetical protein
LLYVLPDVKKLKCTLVQALRLCTGRTVKCTLVQALRLCRGRTVKCSVVQALRLCTGRTVKCNFVQALRLCTGRTAYRWSRGIALTFHDHGTGRGDGSASRPGRSLPRGNTRCPFYRRLGGPQCRSRQVRKISPLPEFDLPTVQPVAQSLYRLSYPAYFVYFGHSFILSNSKLVYVGPSDRAV